MQAINATVSALSENVWEDFRVEKCVICWVYGQVQGVGFRYFTQQEEESDEEAA